MITKVETNHVIVREILTVKDVNGFDVEIYGKAEEYGQDRVTRELAKIEVLLAKKHELLDIKSELEYQVELDKELK